MSGSKVQGKITYIDVDSTYRDRHKYPNPADFKVPYANIRNKNDHFLKKLYRLLELKNISKKYLIDKLISLNYNKNIIYDFINNGEFNKIIYNSVIDILNIFPHELPIYDFNNSDGVILSKFNNSDWIEYSTNYYIKHLALSKFFNDTCATNVKIIGKTQIMQSSFHQYLFFYNSNITFEWGDNLEHKKNISNNDSLYIKPFVKYRFNTKSNYSSFVCVKLAGELTSDYLYEFSTFKQSGVDRIVNESSTWW